MYQFGVRVCIVLFCCLVALSARAQQASRPTIQPMGVSANDTNLTAGELAVNADQLYGARDYAGALALYRKFIESFGEAKEAQEAIRQMRYPMAMCLFHLKKFADAIEAIDVALNVQPPLQPAQVQDLTFWKGVAFLQEEDFDKARETFEKFLTIFPPNAERDPRYVQDHQAILKIPEAKLLVGSCFLWGDKPREAADYLAKIKPSLIPVNRGRATVLQLRALIDAEDYEAANKLVMEEYPRMGDIVQLVTFQTLTLQLGSLYLEKGEYRKAIVCLQRIWDAERLLRHQRERLADMESRLAAAEADANSDPYVKLVLGQLIKSVKSEIKQFEAMPNFDSALRLRLAFAFQKMERYRECALVMEAMLRDMPPDPVVESASVNLVQCWGVVEEWPRAVEAAQLFLEKFPDSKQRPLVLYLEGGANEKMFHYDAAIACYDQILKDYPTSEYAPRALFMRGFTLLLADRPKEGAVDFEKFLREYPQHDMTDAAAYWYGMSFSLDKQFQKARDVMGEYLAQRKDGSFRGGATYRKAYCAQQLEDYQTSIKELKAYIKDYPGHDENNEARVLLADALMNEGQIDEGIAMLKTIPSTIPDQGLYEESYFKISKAYKLLEEYGRFRDHNMAFIDVNPHSLRIGEAVYNVGWAYRQEGNNDKAKEVYWQAIDKYGNDADIHTVDELFPALGKLYKSDGDGGSGYLAKLRDLAAESKAKGKKAMEMRALWAQAQAVKKEDPARANQLVLEAAALADVSKTNPLLMADFAETYIAAGKTKEGEEMWRDLVKWNPRARQKDRALAAMGLLEMERGNEKKALEYFDRFEKETMGSLLFGKIMLAKAQLLTVRGEKEKAREALNTLLGNKFSGGQDKAKALYEIGEGYMKENNPKAAFAAYQKVYVMYGRWRDVVAKSYLRSGEALEQIDDKDGARRTYQELLENEALKDLPEGPAAKKRLDALGGPLPKPAPEEKVEPTPAPATAEG